MKRPWTPVFWKYCWLMANVVDLLWTNVYFCWKLLDPDHCILQDQSKTYDVPLQNFLLRATHLHESWHFLLFYTVFQFNFLIIVVILNKFNLLSLVCIPIIWGQKIFSKKNFWQNTWQMYFCVLYFDSSRGRKFTWPDAKHLLGLEFSDSLLHSLSSGLWAP